LSSSSGPTQTKRARSPSARVDAELGADPRSGVRIGAEAGEVDAVADGALLALRRPARQRLAVGVVLVELGVRELQGDGLGTEDDSALLQRVVGGRPDAMAGVHDDGDAEQPAEDPPEHTRLRVVGVAGLDVDGELGLEQEREAHVDGREVRDAEVLRHVGPPASPWRRWRRRRARGGGGR
jgi:hypothetical protein